MTFHTTLRVRFGDEDHARIVYYPKFFHFFHCAFEDFFDHQGLTYRECLDEGVGWPAVHAEADYRRPVRFGDDLALEVTVTKLSTRSATFRYVGRVASSAERGGGDDGAAVIGTIIVACIDMKTMRAQPIPEKYRALFERHLVAPAAG